jgi:hypothetical protein
MADPLITVMGSLEILVAAVLTVSPSIIYDSPPTRALSSLTGLVSLRCLLRFAKFNSGLGNSISPMQRQLQVSTRPSLVW